ncbi:DNA-binding MarR family transcriptional regulator [Sphingopyxis panaciterrae]|uniref:MarR family winged helix-turn-helix transcriptional regulator n=1 Tax=Sphingopyxis panaciterrae TaxID=363841 RepID=UPI001423A9BC|nr:helix-turn-helix domain-containing protein [Sphingopyxis panaciterrae]NIJ39668.1 DNA-binding MarR family transcriptional regulator [Sphingopyxis panaciterrae]
MQQFSNQEIAELKTRIDQIHELLATRGGDEPATLAKAASVEAIDAPKAILVNQLSFNIQMRRLRKSHFGSAQLSGPVWDMMLDLMLAASNGRELGASDLATGAGVPLSSGLRMIAALEDLGLVRRFIDERDRRRSLVQLTDRGAERMASYFETIGAAWQDGRIAA